MRDYWEPRKLGEAARLLESASQHLLVTYPYSHSSPCVHTLPAVLAMIDAARKCIDEAMPSENDETQ